MRSGPGCATPLVLRVGAEVGLEGCVGIFQVVLTMIMFWEFESDSAANV